MSQPLYEALAEEYSGLIADGQLPAGTRLPSVRTLSRQRRVSLSTALAALRAMESRGLVEARPQSGYYVRPRAPSSPAPRRSEPPARPQAVSVESTIIDLLNAGAGGAAGPLGSAVPDKALLPQAALRRRVGQLARCRPELLAGYSPLEGLPELRVQIAQRYAQLACHAPADEILITNGCTEALHLALRASTQAGDWVALESPTYFGFLQILQSLGLKALELPTDPTQGLDVEALRTALAEPRGRSIRACVVTPNHSNPLGSRMPDTRKQALVDVCAEHGVALIEDDLYGDLPFCGPRPTPLRHFDASGTTMLCSSLSKTLAPGLRVGWLAAGRWAPRVRLLKFATSMCNAGLPQAAAASLIGGGGFDRHLRRLREACAGQVQAMQDAVLRHFPAGTRVAHPAGGFLLWVELPAAIDTLALHRQAVPEGLGFMPGALFTATGDYRSALRLNCGWPVTAETERGLARLGELARQLR